MIKWTAATILAVAAVVIAWLAAPSASSPSGGTVAGRVEQMGPDPNPRPVWVYLVDRDKKAKSRQLGDGTAVIRQEKLEFKPHVIVVQKGTTVSFPNKDNEEHNVFSPRIWDNGRYPPGKGGKSRTFKQPAEVLIYCDIHNNMWAQIKVVETTPALIKELDRDGTFRIDDVPPGTYDVHAWAEGAKESIEQNVVVSIGKTNTVPPIHLQLDKIKPPYHVHWDGRPY